MTKPFESYDYSDLMLGYTTFLKSQDVFKDYNFDGSGIRELLRLLAFDTQQRAFQNNFSSNELNLGTASIRENAVSLAANYGYVSTGKTSAKMVVDIIVTPKDVPESNSLTMKKDVKFFANKNNVILFFSPDKEYTSNLTNGVFKFSNITLVQGSWAYAAFDVTGNSVIESFVLPNKNIDVTKTTVQVRANEGASTYAVYNRYTNGFDLGKNAKIFFTRENRKGFFEIEFGDNKFASRLQYGNFVLVEYLVTDGLNGNEIASVTPAGGIDNYFDIQINTIQKSYLGADAESIEAIRRAAPLSFAHQGSAVAVRNYEGLTKDLFPGIKDVVAWGGEDNIPVRTGTVFVAGVYANQDGLTPTQKNDIAQELKKYNVGTIEVAVVDAQYTYLNLKTHIRFNPNQTLLLSGNIQNKTTDLLRVYSQSNLERFKAFFDKSKLSEFINHIDSSIRGNVTIVSFEKRLTPTINFSGTYTFKFQTGIKEGSVNISGFWVDSEDLFGTVSFSMKDVGGKLVLYKTIIETNISLKIADIGNVNYVDGVIDIIGFRPNAVTSYVAITISPASVDESAKTIGQEIFKIGSISVSTEKVYD